MKKRVLVIGAGAVGLSCAWHLHRNGFDVAVVERLGASRDGCSFGNAGMIVPSHFIPLAAPGAVMQGLRWMVDPESPFYIRPRLDLNLFSWGYQFWRSATRRHVDRAAPLLRDLHLRSVALFQELSAELAIPLPITSDGLVMLCATQDGLRNEVHLANKANALGIVAECCDPRRLAELDAALDIPCAGGVYFPGDCQLKPETYMNALQDALMQAGVETHFGRPIQRIEGDRGRIRSVVCGDSRVSADEFVLCAGVWSSEMVKPLGVSIPMQAGKGYSFTLTPSPTSLRHGLILTEARLAITPFTNGLRVGGAMELCGVDERINERRANAIVKAAVHQLPWLSQACFNGIPPWVGLRPVSPDGLPYVGPTRKWRNLHIACGHAMMGFSLAPVTGECIAAMLAGRSLPFDTALLSPDRFE